jgi:DNA gyrase subunit B
MPGRYLRYPPHPEPRPFSGIHPPGGLKVASGLSETFLLETTTSRTRTILKTERGILVEDPVIEAGDYLETGTKITFLPDREKNLGRWPGSTESENLAFTDYLRPRILVRMHQWAALNPGLTLVLEDRRKGFPHFEQIRYPDGLLSYLRNLNQTEEILSPTLYFEHKHPQFSLSVAIEFSESLRTRIISFANGEHTIEGGPHVTGVVAGLLSAYRQRSKGRHKFLKSEDVLPGISAVVAIELQRPKFTSAAHIRLVNEVHADVRRVTQRNIARFFRENPKIADTLVSNITSAFQRRYRSHDKSPFGL